MADTLYLIQLISKPIWIGVPKKPANATWRNWTPIHIALLVHWQVDFIVVYHSSFLLAFINSVASDPTYHDS